MKTLTTLASTLTFLMGANLMDTNLMAGDGTGALRLPAIFGDNMVLQANMATPVWGWASPGQTVTVQVAGQSKSAQAGDNGKWMLKLDPLAAGGPVEMTVACGAGSITFRNVLIGEVWVCSGQSNMGLGTGAAADGLKEVRAAKFPKIRFFAVPMHASADKPAEDIGAPWGCFFGKWVECSPDTAGAFPAVGYFFGRKLHQELGVPVGLIESVWGGTGLDAWVSRQCLGSDAAFKPMLDRADAWLKTDFAKAKAKYEAQMAQYDKARLQKEVRDEAVWPSPTLDDKDWPAITLPGSVAMNGVVWFRRTVDLPAMWAGQALRLELGAISDDDTTYVNGQELGRTGGWQTPREYDVPASLTAGGQVTIAVRVVCFGGNATFSAKPETMALLAPHLAGAKPLPLAGVWKHQVALKTAVLPLAWDYQTPPGAVYNGMVAPLIPYGIRGVAWYQGESGGTDYARLFPAMIRDWRKSWGQGDFPFLFVQLPNISPHGNQAVEDGWVSVREAMFKTLAVPNTGMAVTIDVGDPEEVHCAKKQPVGLRLALWALANVYGKELVYSGPLYESMSVEGGKVRLKFRHVGGGLVARDGPLRQFIIAGKDRQFVPAEAVIEGDSVVVWSDKAPAPAAVRYAWLCNPVGCNLYNKAGLPASPFRTDDWPKEPSAGK